MKVWTLVVFKKILCAEATYYKLVNCNKIKLLYYSLLWALITYNINIECLEKTKVFHHKFQSNETTHFRVNFDNFACKGYCAHVKNSF